MVASTSELGARILLCQRTCCMGSFSQRDSPLPCHTAASNRSMRHRKAAVELVRSPRVGLRERQMRLQASLLASVKITSFHLPIKERRPETPVIWGHDLAAARDQLMEPICWIRRCFTIPCWRIGRNQTAKSYDNSKQEQAWEPSCIAPGTRTGSAGAKANQQPGDPGLLGGPAGTGSMAGMDGSRG